MKRIGEILAGVFLIGGAAAGWAFVFIEIERALR